MSSLLVIFSRVLGFLLQWGCFGTILWEKLRTHCRRWLWLYQTGCRCVLSLDPCCPTSRRKTPLSSSLAHLDLKLFKHNTNIYSFKHFFRVLRNKQTVRSVSENKSLFVRFIFWDVLYFGSAKVQRVSLWWVLASCMSHVTAEK